MDPPEFTIIVPVLNEEHNLEKVLQAVAADCRELIVVDGGSEDDTVAISQKYASMVFRQDDQGKGDAIRSAAGRASSSFLVIIDGDGSHDPEEIPRMVSFLRNHCDVVKASRFLPEGGTADMGFIRKIGNRFFVWLANRLFRTSFSDLCYGLMAIRKEALTLLSTREKGFAIDVEIFLKAAKKGLAIREMPSFEKKRNSGKSRLRIIPDGGRILYVILRERFT